MKFIKPNFKNNILNISASLAEFLGAENKNTTNKIIDKELKKNYKNVVFIIFDGMGINPININLDKNSFIRKNIKDKITSVFPSTTTNATTTILTNKMPLEHGWVGWSIYFKELNRAVDIYLNSDSYTKEKIDENFLPTRIPIEPYYKHAKTDYTISKVVPPYWQDGIPENRYTFTETDVMFKHIKGICSANGKQFVYCYCPEPDATMHDFGVSSSEAKKVFDNLNKKVEELTKSCSNTLFIITADHGQTDVVDYINIYENKDIMELLEVKPYLEPRATAFKVKEGKNIEFEKVFKQCYGKDFKLFKSEKLLKQNYFGTITSNKEFLADYIAVCKTNKVFRFSTEHPQFKGHHTSLGKEMLVPLVIYANKETN